LGAKASDTIGRCSNPGNAEREIDFPGLWKKGSHGQNELNVQSNIQILRLLAIRLIQQ
jgi:hypothetical protein